MCRSFPPCQVEAVAEDPVASQFLSAGLPFFGPGGPHVPANGLQASQDRVRCAAACSPDRHFGALYRDAREDLEEQGIALGDPFAHLRWQKTIRRKPDPVTPECEPSEVASLLLTLSELTTCLTLTKAGAGICSR